MHPDRPRARELSAAESDLLNAEKDRIVALLEANSIDPNEFFIKTLRNSAGVLSVDIHVLHSHYEGDSQVSLESIKVRQILESEGIEFNEVGDTTSIEVKK